MSILSPLTKGCFHFDHLISKVFIQILYICLALKRTFSFISFRVSSVKTTLLLTKHPMQPYLTHQHKQKKIIKKIYIKTTPLHSFYPFSVHKNGVVSLYQIRSCLLLYQRHFFTPIRSQSFTIHSFTFPFQLYQIFTLIRSDHDLPSSNQITIFTNWKAGDRTTEIVVIFGTMSCCRWPIEVIDNGTNVSMEKYKTNKMSLMYIILKPT